MGQAIVMTGSYMANDESPEVPVNKTGYYIMVFGRFFFGLGAESMSVAQSAIVAQWFKGKELAFAFAVNTSVGGIGSAVGGNITVAAYNTDRNIGTPMLVGLGMCLISGCFAIVLCILDKKADMEDAKNKNSEDTN